MHIREMAYNTARFSVLIMMAMYQIIASFAGFMIVVDFILTKGQGYFQTGVPQLVLGLLLIATGLMTKRMLDSIDR